MRRRPSAAQTPESRSRPRARGGRSAGRPRHAGGGTRLRKRLAHHRHGQCGGPPLGARQGPRSRPDAHRRGGLPRDRAMGGLARGRRGPHGHADTAGPQGAALHRRGSAGLLVPGARLRHCARAHRSAARRERRPRAARSWAGLPAGPLQGGGPRPGRGHGHGGHGGVADRLARGRFPPRRADERRDGPLQAAGRQPRGLLLIGRAHRRSRVPHRVRLGRRGQRRRRQRAVQGRWAPQHGDRGDCSADPADERVVHDADRRSRAGGGRSARRRCGAGAALHGPGRPGGGLAPGGGPQGDRRPPGGHPAPLLAQVRGHRLNGRLRRLRAVPSAGLVPAGADHRVPRHAADDGGRRRGARSRGGGLGGGGRRLRVVGPAPNGQDQCR